MLLMNAECYHAFVAKGDILEPVLALSVIKHASIFLPQDLCTCLCTLQPLLNQHVSPLLFKREAQEYR